MLIITLKQGDIVYFIENLEKGFFFHFLGGVCHLGVGNLLYIPWDLFHTGKHISQFSLFYIKIVLVTLYMDVVFNA
jgi:hypothetical protein